LVGCLLVVAAVWLLRSPKNATNDEERLREMVRAERAGSRIRSIERYLPLFVIEKLRLDVSWLHKEEFVETQRSALLASGFLTNVSFTLTNLPRTATKNNSTFLEVHRRLRALRGIDYWSFHMQSNQAIITCRPGDLPRIRSGIEVP
jgi:hypothetical protein